MADLSLIRNTARPIPAQIGRYRILCELGQGAMGVLYLARPAGPVNLQRLFAVKVMHEHLARDPSIIDMFLNEARIASRVRHPNVISVYDVDLAGDRYFLAMDYVSGENLALTLKHAWSRAQNFPLEAAARIVADVCEGLHAAHELKDAQGRFAGIVHRDVTPQNLMVGYDGATRLMDFGLARAGEEPPAIKGIKGTVAYMSPEQVKGDPIDRRSDIFSLGVVLWEATIGKRLFKSATDTDTAARVMRMKIPRPIELRDNYPGSLERVVLRALSRDPEQRYSTAREMGLDLEQYLSSRPRHFEAADVEQMMKDIFASMYARRSEMEAQALADVPPDHLDNLPQPDVDPSLSNVEGLGEDLIRDLGPARAAPTPISRARPTPRSAAAADRAGDLSSGASARTPTQPAPISQRAGGLAGVAKITPSNPLGIQGPGWSEVPEGAIRGPVDWMSVRVAGTGEVGEQPPAIRPALLDTNDLEAPPDVGEPREGDFGRGEARPDVGEPREGDGGRGEAQPDVGVPREVDFGRGEAPPDVGVPREGDFGRGEAPRQSHGARARPSERLSAQAPFPEAAPLEPPAAAPMFHWTNGQVAHAAVPQGSLAAAMGSHAAPMDSQVASQAEPEPEPTVHASWFDARSPGPEADHGVAHVSGFDARSPGREADHGLAHASGFDARSPGPEADHGVGHPSGFDARSPGPEADHGVAHANGFDARSPGPEADHGVAHASWFDAPSPGPEADHGVDMSAFFEETPIPGPPPDDEARQAVRGMRNRTPMVVVGVGAVLALALAIVMAREPEPPESEVAPRAVQTQPPPAEATTPAGAKSPPVEATKPAEGTSSAEGKSPPAQAANPAETKSPPAQAPNPAEAKSPPAQAPNPAEAKSPPAQAPNPVEAKSPPAQAPNPTEAKSPPAGLERAPTSAPPAESGSPRAPAATPQETAAAKQNAEPPPPKPAPQAAAAPKHAAEPPAPKPAPQETPPPKKAIAATAPKPPPRPTEVLVELDLDPANATVLVDRQKHDGPLMLRAAKRHIIEVSAPGYETALRSISPRAPTKVTIHLKPIPKEPKEPPPAKQKTKAKPKKSADDSVLFDGEDL